MLQGRKFQFRPTLTIFVVLALGILIWLGTWQMHRLEWKTDLITKVESRLDAAPIPFAEAIRRADAGEDMEYTPVKITGEPRSETAPVFGSLDAKAGVYFFVPHETAENETVYVNLGFVPQQVEMPTFKSMEKSEITGLFRRAEVPTPPASWFSHKGKSVDGLWFVRDPVQFSGEAKIETVPYYIDQLSVPGREWPKGGTTRIEFNNRHLEYALTWYGLALTLVGVWLVFSLQPAKDDN